MTAEIAILNRSVVALAADSAVTIDRKRAWKSSNKLFSLGPRHDIGVMVHGHDSFLGKPWEAIIEQFRSRHADAAFLTVEQCVTAFRAFATSSVFRHAQREEFSVGMVVFEAVTQMVDRIGTIQSKAMLVAGAAADATNHIAELSADLLPDNPSKPTFEREFRDFIKDTVRDSAGYRLGNANIQPFIDVAFEHYRRTIASEFRTGVVFAGFGSQEQYPKLHEITFDGMDSYVTRVWEENRVEITSNLLPSAVICPFAQSDVFHLFVEGIAMEHIQYTASLVGSVLAMKSDTMIRSYVPGGQRTVESALQRRENDTILTEMIREYKKYRKSNFVSPLLEVVATLPKDEMANLAEALVELTSLRRKIAGSVQTVGGPTDVAVISKADGFIWMKRKQYFNIDENPDYQYRRRQN